MIDNTINDAKTIVDGGKGVILAGRYHILRQLGEGGMGSVWLAEDRQLDNRKVAIKMLPSILVADKRAYQQLKREALVSLKLVHPNIVTLRVFEENNGAPFLVMDYVEGQTLNDYLAVKGKLSEAETMELLKPIAAALDYAHGEKVIHRDVKPSNIIIRQDGHPFILDFGIAREIQETMTRVTGGTISGTLLYMSPEQLRGASPSTAQDVYSFAAMVYECLSGHPPFVRGDISYQLLNEIPKPLPPDISISELVLNGLSKLSEKRPVTCSSLFNSITSASAPRSGDLHAAFEKMLKLLTSTDDDCRLNKNPIETISGLYIGQKFAESDIGGRKVCLRGKDEEKHGCRIFGINVVQGNEDLQDYYLYEDFLGVFAEVTLVTNTVWNIILHAGVKDEYKANCIVDQIKGKLERAYLGKFLEVLPPTDKEKYWYITDVKKSLRMEAQRDNRIIEIVVCFDEEGYNPDNEYDVYVSMTDPFHESLRKKEFCHFKQEA